MKECEKWLNRDGIDILRPELRHWKGIEIEDGFKKGWKAALELVLAHRKPYYDIEDKKVVATDSDIIYKELEGE